MQNTPGCMCEDRDHDDADVVCLNKATVTQTYDGIDIPMCGSCVKAHHMGEPDRGTA